MFIRIFAILGLLSMLSGCASTLNAHYNRDVVEDNLSSKRSKANKGELAMLSLTSQRRVIISDLEKQRFCSESPPESADNIASSLSAAFQSALNQKGTIDASANLQLADSFSSSVSQLYRRSHYVQLFRDVAFQLCVDSINTSTTESHSKTLLTILDKIIPGLDKEIEHFYNAEKVRFLHGEPTNVVANSGVNINKAEENQETEKTDATEIMEDKEGKKPN